MNDRYDDHTKEPTYRSHFNKKRVEDREKQAEDSLEDVVLRLIDDFFPRIILT